MNLVSLTVDVESDWGGRLHPRRENCMGIERGLPQLLFLLDQSKIKATFFVSTSIFTLYRDLIRQIKIKGHEIASHGYLHLDYSKLKKDDLLYQVRKSKGLLEDSLDCQVLGFRAPQFIIHPDLYEVLFLSGYQYDSSLVYGKLRGRYNNSKTDGRPFKANYNILEIPISNIPLTNKPLGLLWINLLSFSLFSILEKLSKDRQNVVFYLHPFDIISKKSKNNFGMFINFWYSFKADNVFATFRKFIEYYSGDSIFVTLNKYLEKNYGCT